MGIGFVSQIHRGEEQLHAVSPDFQLEGGDILWIAGNAEAMALTRNKKGLRPYGVEVCSYYIAAKMSHANVSYTDVADGQGVSIGDVNPLPFYFLPGVGCTHTTIPYVYGTLTYHSQGTQGMLNG